MSLKEELEALAREAKTEDPLDFIKSLNAQLGLVATDKGVKSKPKPKLTPEQVFEQQWTITSLVLLVDVRTCLSCNQVHTMPAGFFLEQIHQVATTDRRYSRVTQAFGSLPDAYRSLPSRMEHQETKIGFCDKCFGLPLSANNPFYQHEHMTVEQATAPNFMGPTKK